MIYLPNSKNILPTLHKTFEKEFEISEQAWGILLSTFQEQERIGKGNTTNLNQCLVDSKQRELSAFDLLLKNIRPKRNLYST